MIEDGAFEFPILEIERGGAESRFIWLLCDYLYEREISKIIDCVLQKKNIDMKCEL